MPDVVRKVFAEYPNVINEIINLSLSNGEALSEGDQTFERTNEFLEQFESGQAKRLIRRFVTPLGAATLSVGSR
ncbi:hypothetical protein ACNKHM_17670 [Shigella sonnei]